MSTCGVQSCGGDVVAKGLCNKHYHKLQRYGTPTAGYEEQRPKGQGSLRHGGYHRRYIEKKEKLEHVLIVERLIGKALPKGACVHHVDGNHHNNAHGNLVVCPSAAYHKLLHQRQAALDATGNADWRSCNRCHQYDAPEKLYISANHSTVYHRKCEAEYVRTRRSINKLSKGETS